MLSQFQLELCSLSYGCNNLLKNIKVNIQCDPGSGHYTISKYQIYFSGSTNDQLQNGEQSTERILLFQLNRKPVHLNILQYKSITNDKLIGSSCGPWYSQQCSPSNISNASSMRLSASFKELHSDLYKKWRRPFFYV